MRLTKEREAEIREAVKYEGYLRCEAAKALLDEIDCLRNESEFRHSAAKNYAESCGILRAELEYLSKKSDQLKSKLEVATNALIFLEAKLLQNVEGEQQYGGFHTVVDEFQSLWNMSHIALRTLVE